MTQQQQSEYSPYRGLKKLGALLVTKQQPKQPDARCNFEYNIDIHCPCSH